MVGSRYNEAEENTDWTEKRCERHFAWEVHSCLKKVWAEFWWKLLWILNPNLWTVIYKNISICASAASLYPPKGCLYYLLVAVGGPEVGYACSAGQSQYFRGEAQVSEEYTDLHSAWQGTFLASCHVEAHDKTTEQLLTWCHSVEIKLRLLRLSTVV